jgi:hypothetical protein
MTEFEATPFVFPEIAGRKVLVLGLGGGCDIVTAFAVSRLLPGGPSEGVFYGNTKQGNMGAVEPVTAHVVRLSGPQLDPARHERGNGKAWIDRSVPRSPNGSPWIVLLDHDRAEQDLPGELRSLGLDLVIGVDTGGDSIAHKAGRGRRGRDQRMLAVLRRSGLPTLHVVVAPGCDGEASFDDLKTQMQRRAEQGHYRGCFSVSPLLDTYRSFSASLGATRTPQIILAAAESRLAKASGGRVIVPRGREPAVPESWLASAYVFDAETESV